MTHRRIILDSDFPLTITVRPVEYPTAIKFIAKSRKDVAAIAAFVRRIENISQNDVAIRSCIDGHWVALTSRHVEKMGKINPISSPFYAKEINKYVKQ